jgi:hypothetical protein
VYTEVVRETEETEMSERKVKVGDVFYASWGYDQTNVNFFAVVAVSKTGKTATFVELTKTHLGSSERIAGNAAQCRYCGEGVRKLVKVDGSSVYRHVATGRTECQFYGYRAEQLAKEGRVLHAEVVEFKRRVRQRAYGDGLAANWKSFAGMYSDDEVDANGNQRGHYETPVGYGH